MGVFAGGDPGEDFDGDAVLEQVVQDDEAFEEVASESVDFVDGEHSSGRYLRDCFQQDWPVLSCQFAAGFFFEDFPADRLQCIVLPGGVLFIGTDPD